MTHQPAPIVNRRRVRLVDDDIQKTLLVALVLMETIGVAIAIWMLYRALGEIVDENTYRIHFAEGASIWSQLSREGWRVFSAMLAVNVVALIIADRIWAFYVKRVVRNLDRLMEASRRLDFTGHEASTFNHAVLDQATNWRRAELQRLERLRKRTADLPPQLPETAAQREALAAVLKNFNDA